MKYALVGSLILIIVAAPILASSAGGSSVENSGSFMIDLENQAGRSLYTIYYTHPDKVTTGSNLNITLTLLVDDLTGVKLYLQDYELSVLIHVPNRLPLTSSVSANSGRVLYPGSHWGPLNLSIPIKASELGLGAGETRIANLSIAFLGNVWYDYPVTYFFLDSGSHMIGTVEILNPSPNNLSLIYVAIFSAFVALGAAVVLIRKTGKRQS